MKYIAIILFLFPTFAYSIEGIFTCITQKQYHCVFDSNGNSHCSAIEPNTLQHISGFLIDKKNHNVSYTIWSPMGDGINYEYKTMGSEMLSFVDIKAKFIYFRNGNIVIKDDKFASITGIIPAPYSDPPSGEIFNNYGTCEFTPGK